MWPDPIAPIAGATAAAANAVRTPAPTTNFAAVLEAQQVAPESLPTVTLGEMLGRGFAEAPARVSWSANMTGLTPDLPASLAVPAVAGTATATATLAWPVQGRITSEFGPRVHPITGVRRAHQGLDIAASTGTPIAAAAGGKVTFAGTQGGYGNVVIVDHGNGVETRYAHQDTIAVHAGQAVTAGQRLGTVGSTGMSTGPHLHFEVRREGQPVDPRRFLG